MRRTVIASSIILVMGTPRSLASPPQATRTPLLRVLDLAVGELQQVELSNGEKASVKLVDLRETRDPIRSAVRGGRNTVPIETRIACRQNGSWHSWDARNARCLRFSGVRS